MKKNFVVAMAITAGMCFAGSGHVKPAFAGYWEEVTNQYSNPWGNTSDPNYNNWLREQQDRKDGAGSYDFFRQIRQVLQSIKTLWIGRAVQTATEQAFLIRLSQA